jgi:hypothetical protein
VTCFRCIRAPDVIFHVKTNFLIIRDKLLKFRFGVLTIVWDVTPRTLVKFCRRFRGSYCFHLQGQGEVAIRAASFLRIVYMAYSSALNMDAVRPSETFTRLKSTIFWDIEPCSPFSVNRRFWGTYSLHLQGLKNISSARNQRASRWQAARFC